MAPSSARRWSPVSAGKDELEERLRSHYESLSRVIRFTRTADAKAAPVLALQIALLGALATRSEELYHLMISVPRDAERTAVIGLVIVYGLLLTAVIVLAAWVYLPMNGKTGRSLIFFEDIARMEWGEFQSAARNMSHDLIERQLLHQIYVVAGVASVKMRRVHWAIIISLPAILVWFALLAWSHL